MKKSKSSVIKNMLFMVKLTTFCAILLLITRAAVGDKAELSVRTADSILQIIGKATLPSEEIAVENFKENFTMIQTGRIKLWRHNKQKELIACEATGSGMWGEITLTFVLNTKSLDIIGLKVIEQKETVGLGARIADLDFSEKFIGLKAENGIRAVHIKVKNNEFDCISGATISSKSVEKLVNKSLKIIRQKINE